MFNFLILLNIVFILNTFLISAEISDKRLCVNKDCTEIIGYGTTQLPYSKNDNDPRLLSYKKNKRVTIYSKSAGTNPKLWGVEIDGKRGYAPYSTIVENSLLRNATLIVDTEKNTVPFQDENKKETVKPEPTKSYEVVDGTTITNSLLSTETSTPESNNFVNSNDKTPPLNSDLSQKNSQQDAVSVSLTPNSEINTLNIGENNKNFESTETVTDFTNQQENIHQPNNNPVIESVETNKTSSEILSDNKADGSKNVAEQATTKKEAPSPIQNDEKVPIQGSVVNTVSKEDDDDEENDGDDEGEEDDDDDGMVEEDVETDDSKIQSDDTRNIIEAASLEVPSVKEEPNKTHEYGNKQQSEAATDEKTESSKLDVQSDLQENVQEINKDLEMMNKEELKNFATNNPIETSQYLHNETETETTPQVDVNKVEIATESSNSGEMKHSEFHNNNNYVLDKDNIAKVNEQLYSHNEPVSHDDQHEYASVGVPDELKNFATNQIKIETSTVEPPQDEMPNPHDVGVVTDNPIETSQYLHNETETETTPQVDVNKVEIAKESSNSGEMKHSEFHDNNNYVLEKDNIEKVNKQLYSHNEPVSHDDQHEYASVGVPDQSENQNENDDGSKTYFEMYQNSNDEYQEKEIKDERENEIKQQIHDAEIQAAENIESHKHDFNSLLSQRIDDELSCSADPLSDCKIHPQDLRAVYDSNNIFTLPNSAILTVLVIAAVTVVTFLWGYMYMEKRGRESKLVGKINNIQKDYLIAKKENEILKDKLEDVESEFNEKANAISNEMLLEVQEQLDTEKNTRSTLEVQIQNLEKELENSTEVGLELNRMLSEFLNSENGSETLVANIEQLQRQIIEQQATINTYNENLSMKETENHELRLEVDINNTKVTELQSELNKMALNLLKLEEDKEQSQSMYESVLEKVKEELESKKGSFTKEKNKFKEQLQDLKDKCEQVQRDLELKSNEYLLLKESISQIKKIENNGDALKSLLDMTAIQAQLLQLRKEKQLLIEQLQDERNKSSAFEIQCQSALQDSQNFKEKYDAADREKVEATTKLQVLDKYFKEREAHLQKELSKQESMWTEKQGEATSTIERIKYMQEELQNYKGQNESLKQEILEQEVQLKSQISVLEKKAHENWVSVRQAERKLEEAKQEAAQLRNRLTLRERSFTEEKMHNRVQSPLEQNGEIPVSPAHMSNDTAASPPLLYGTRENLTISPPLPGLPFLPPPPGVPFMPPPLGGVPLPPPGFMPPPPSLMPGDHRPPPLGRISSPPLNSRYSPDRAYSPYSRNTPSPMSDDDYDRMPQPPMYRGYNSYNRDDRREIHRPPPVRANVRNNKGGHSSGSANSNDSLDKINRHNSKV